MLLPPRVFWTPAMINAFIEYAKERENEGNSCFTALHSELKRDQGDDQRIETINVLLSNDGILFPFRDDHIDTSEDRREYSAFVRDVQGWVNKRWKPEQ